MGPDLQSKILILLKGWLFLLGGLLASAALLIEHFHWKTALLLGLAVWCFARFYYFAFYVIEHYVDPDYRFAGLWDFFKYSLRRQAEKPTQKP
ncbi:hypothetical protein [Algisphaera agarilytica]|uniref:Uncharacterized protein n=1 Tax=Algisphaera agarilytica TaxID=1385975 RepID=A0A7X0LLX0_9BACT|nr:hypothetical protein [Algisphaera agarilytica]MBB6431056.1 hypothetical protein [Algisphaera agarilytica]